VRDYLLFIDTETTGLPRSWQEPYSDQDNWPFSVQIAWVIYTKTGELVKRESHYIKDQDFDISPAAFRVHGISRNFLLRHGESRQDIMRLLAADLTQYQPLVVAHYMQLDYHMLGADFYRTGIDNPLEKLPVFCTMLATARYVSNPRAKYLRLNRLYYILFNRELENQHEALADAQATAECFFEMLRLGDIREEQIRKQQPLLKGGKSGALQRGCLLTFFACIVLTIIISLWR
jgi:DNA polymerase III subunit epsilon